MKTFQDYQEAVTKGAVIDFVRAAISEHMSSEDYKIALDADEYEAERNTTIMEWVKHLYTMDGRAVPDFTSMNHKLASNFFHRLNTQRATYSLGNGISFQDAKVKERLGSDFDTVLFNAAYSALIHKCSFIFWNLDHADYFKFTEFVPLWDEYTGALRAGIRFWSLDWGSKPVTVVLYEEDGYTKYQTRPGSKGLDIIETEAKRGYIQIVQHSEAEGDQVIGEDSYGTIPIVPLWGGKNKQSTLVGLKGKIDAYDLIISGFANDLQECAEIYWIIGNAMGMPDQDLAKFRDRLKLNHIAAADTDNSSVTAYTQEVPSVAKTTFLNSIKAQIYEDFGALDVHTISAGATNDHIDAGYQPMDEEADAFEYQIIKCVQQILRLIGIEDQVPLFNRNRISNLKERTEMILMAANYLDDETILSKFPFITPDEVKEILRRREVNNEERINSGIPE